MNRVFFPRLSSPLPWLVAFALGGGVASSCKHEAPTTTSPDFTDIEVKPSYDRYLERAQAFCEFSVECGTHPSEGACLQDAVTKLEGTWPAELPEIAACLDAWTARDECRAEMECEQYASFLAGTLKSDPCKAQQKQWATACMRE